MEYLERHESRRASRLTELCRMWGDLCAIHQRLSRKLCLHICVRKSDFRDLPFIVSRRGQWYKTSDEPGSIDSCSFPPFLSRFAEIALMRSRCRNNDQH